MPNKIIIDARNMACPGPVTKVVRAYRKASNGDIIEVHATDPGFKPDIKSWIEKTGNELVELKEEDGIIKAIIRVTAK
ncbi:MAG: sulfurtransferase TusA family protein [Desulfurococcales archaeon]|nr:sulfurtransferase TusA family protein [Desulfurococcales archaeon]